MKRICACIALFLAVTLTVFAQDTGAVQGHSFIGGAQSITQGLKSTNYSDGIIPAATITVYNTGTQTKATIFADILGTPLSNPFTSNALNGNNPGGWIFFVATGQGVDVVGTGGGGNPNCTTAPNCYVQPVTLCKDCYASQQFTVSAGVNSVQGTFPIQVNGFSGEPFQGNVDVMCPSCGGANFQYQYIQQGTGQYVLVPFTTATCSATESGTSGSSNGVAGNPPQLGSGFYNVGGGATGTCVFSNPVLTGITTGQITAIYAVGWKSLQTINGGGGAEESAHLTTGGTGLASCDPVRNGNVGGAVTTPLQYGCQVTGTFANFSTITATAQANSAPFHAGTSLFSYVAALEVDYTGSPVTETSGTINLGPGFGWNPSTDTLSLLDYAIYPLTVSALAGLPTQPAYTYNLVLDGADATDCKTGGGTFTVWCEVNTSGTLTGIPFGGGSGAVSSVANSDGSLTITPTTGNVIASLNAAHANTFTATQTFSGVTLSAITGLTQCLHVNSSGQISGTGSDCGAGGGGIGGSGTLGHVPLFTPNGTTLGNSHLDEVTTASTDTFTQPVAVASSGPSQQSFTYNATPLVPGSSTTAVYGVDSSGHAVGSEAGSTAARFCTATNGICLTSGSNPWQASFTFVGIPANSQLLLLAPSTVAVTIPGSCAGSYMGGTVSATGSAAFLVIKLAGGPTGSATTLCTATFSASGNTAAFTGSGGSLTAGDYLEITGPSTADASLANLGGGIYGTH